MCRGVCRTRFRVGLYVEKCSHGGYLAQLLEIKIKYGLFKTSKIPDCYVKRQVGAIGTDNRTFANTRFATKKQMKFEVQALKRINSYSNTTYVL